MDTLKVMLQKRGFNVSAPTLISHDFPAEITKIDKAVVFMSNRARINEKDIPTILEISSTYGGEIAIVVVPIPASSTILSAIRQQSKRIQLFHIGQLQFDISTHRKVPPHRILTVEERKTFQDTYHINSPATQLPFIDSQDSMARWIGAVPGDIIEILRKSESAGTTPYYRYCVADTAL